MISKLARYKVKRNKIPLVKRAIRKFVRGIKNKEIGTLIYEAFQLPDKMSFINFMRFKDKKSEEIHRKSRNTMEFVKFLYPNCVQKPKFVDLIFIK